MAANGTAAKTQDGLRENKTSAPTVAARGACSSTKGASEERGKWSGKLDFVFSCINYAIGLGNVWRFPYLSYENGGGKYVSKGGVGVWNMVPIFKGVGMASMVMVCFSNVYYIIIVAWIMFYLVSSFTSELPWDKCGNYWNTDSCLEPNGTLPGNVSFVNPVQEFWERRVLQASAGLHEMGTVRGELALYLFLAWVIVYFVTWKGIHKSGKVSARPLLYCFLLGSEIVARKLPWGSICGLTHVYYPDRGSTIGDRDDTMWEGKFHREIYILVRSKNIDTILSFFRRDSMILCFVNPMTSILAGTVIFSVLGHMAYISGKDVGDVVKSGPGLAFLAYPEVVAKMPAAPVWSVLFFLMLLTVGIDSQFCTAEALVAGFMDVWPLLVKYRKYVTLVFCTIQFLLGLPMVMQGGIYLFQLVDSYAVSGITLLTILFCSLNHPCYLPTGSRRFASNIKEMIGYAPNLFFKLGWAVFIPFFCTTIFTSSIVQYKPPVYAKTYFYPWWGEMIGWLLSLVSISMIPAYAVYYVVSSKGSFSERIKCGLTSTCRRRQRVPEGVPLHPVLSDAADNKNSS
ncbi:sodium/chloride-dependent GABA transporter, putative [Ixodes scapularis]|uniref:Transporter n=1 Tax=Ixodes scapularis TaxID=6945 RepID=B7Q8Z6_IXOSC|nr:sodium/chloride-dependent GABA transporter, putative [Ixodes scapularis]|eukprot:XP_002405499.1 sodium/chloride-dependent GABA transporter, putative [Ixodes scapularis]